ncbi:MAG: beta-aspartyl-peptidase (threonine type) [Sphingobacteriales bacterium]|jgi:beta-aspartyl-peptidase (threonine type)
MFSIAIHGGAGTILKSQMTEEKELAYRTGLEEAINAGYAILENGGSSLDAVQAAVVELENNPMYNAGKGSVFTHDGTHEMDAAIMEGAELKAGAVVGVTGIKNPVELARMIMDNSDHVMLCGTGAAEFAKTQNMAFENPEYFHTEHRYAQLQQALREGKVILDHTTEKKFGTVGAVAIDSNGNLAAATSTGGMTNKQFGRAGDSPIIGSGTYANNNNCAISCTGHGEYFIRAVVAFDVAALMEYGKFSLTEACDIVVKQKLVKMNGEGGLIAIDKHGNIELSFNSEGMYRAYRKKGEELVTGIYKD